MMVKPRRFEDPPCMPGSGLGPEALFIAAQPLAGTSGGRYVERRGVPLKIASGCGVRFAEDFAGRPAVVAVLRDADDQVTSIHGRYLHTRRGQSKMLTIGPGNGLVSLPGGWRAEPLILVEGLFDVLSLATCGYAAIATIGRRSNWLAKAVQGREVWLAFDAGRPGEAEAARYAADLHGATVRRLPLPPRCQDWNTALRKRGPSEVGRWLHEQLTTGER
jgi:hypothetical protein